MNILAIGNSFSQDATTYLHQVAKADGEDITVINLYIGGCSLERHYKNIMADAPEYDLQFNGVSTKVKVSIRQALISRKWDYIVTQQCSPECTVYGSYQPYLNKLAEYIRFYAPGAELIIQQTWAYEKDSARLNDMVGYSDPEFMYRDLKIAYDKAAEAVGARLIPCGEAFIRLARRGIVHHRDTFHASRGLGRYTLALTWYETLTGKPAIGNALREFDEEIDEAGIRAAQECAHEAVEARKNGWAENPKKKIAVFDLDGTLVDSMPYFTKGMLSIADEAGLTYDDNLIKILTPLGYTKSAEYYVNELGVQDTVPNIVKRIEKKLVYEYTNNIYLKPGVLNYLKKLRDEGTELYVLTASPHIVTDACLRHNGVQGTFHWFDKVWSVEDFGLSKSDPQIFYEAAKKIGCEPGDIHYFDDSLIALRNARKAGYITYGVVDAHTEAEIETMKELSDTLVTSFEEL
ncbi:MAG: DUF4886 domain-containing protein [Clostridia bacterium]|nr:DUF4886 domain-containing protein [Clostridia bacterium]